MAKSQTDGHVFPHRLPGEKAIVLEDHGDVSPNVCGGGSVDPDSAFRGWKQPGDKVEQGCLSATGWPDNRAAFPGVDREADGPEGFDTPRIGKLKVADLYHAGPA